MQDAPCGDLGGSGAENLVMQSVCRHVEDKDGVTIRW